uniref:Uncharacterized protein n=1 Tax=Chenopodium quinoa TaxID=63459 RepID=A0A803ML19_CHEQI
VLAPCLSLNWRDLITREFRPWWSKVIVSDLRDKIDILCSSTEANPNESRKSQEHASDTNAPQPKTNDGSKSNHDTFPKQGNSKPMIARDVSQGNSSNDRVSGVNYKHKRKNFPVVPTDIPLDDQDFKSVVADFLEYEPILPAPRPTAGKGMGIRTTADRVHDNSPNLLKKALTVGLQSPTQSQRSIDGPHSLELASKALRFNMQLWMTVQLHLSIGAQYLEMLQASPYLEVPKRFEEASMVYRGIQNLKGDPTPLNRKVESYVCSVKSYFYLEEVAVKRKKSEQVERDILAQLEVLKQMESNLADKQKRHEQLKNQDALVIKRVEDLEAELTRACK